MRKSIANRPLPCGPALTAYEPETPLASELPTTPKLRRRQMLCGMRRIPRPLEQPSAATTTSRAQKSTKGMLHVQCFSRAPKIFFCIFSTSGNSFNLVYFTKPHRAECLGAHTHSPSYDCDLDAVGNRVANDGYLFD
jgi:hypothetical protein